MPELEEHIPLRVEVVAIKYEVTKLQTEFRYFRNIMITLYLTIIAPLMVAMIMNFLEKR